MAEDSNKILFVDTEAITTQYYLDMYLHKSSALIDSIAKIQKYISKDAKLSEYWQEYMV